MSYSPLVPSCDFRTDVGSTSFPISARDSHYWFLIAGSLHDADGVM
ncbi:hypothetical protein [Calycomorphotria hydatis]|nr:hypothetical protein [Calycomorphotria hydatis]